MEMNYVDMLDMQPEGYTPSLISGLEFFINQVEKMEHVNDFMMSMYPYCVIGTTFGWAHWGGLQRSILRDFFGIDVYSRNLVIDLYRNKLFSSESSHLYSEVEWEVIRLFTSDLPLFLDEFDNVSKYEWLVLARETLSDLKLGVCDAH